jgi:hypothetical protein
MPKEIFPSSYECDCGHRSHFFANTIREMKAMSLKKKGKQYLSDSERENHEIVFYQGEMVDIVCPRHNKQHAEITPNTNDNRRRKDKRKAKDVK